LKKTSVEKFIIPSVSDNEQKPFIALVDKILITKQLGKDCKELEKQLDDLVYKLFNISEEEIEVIEKK
jgi:hypothetical protein